MHSRSDALWVITTTKKQEKKDFRIAVNAVYPIFFFFVCTEVNSEQNTCTPNASYELKTKESREYGNYIYRAQVTTTNIAK